MPMPTMENDTHSAGADPVRDAIQERLRAHRERRAKRYGRDRNLTELPQSVTDEALAFQAEVQGNLRDVS